MHIAFANAESGTGHSDVDNNAVLDRRAQYGRLAPPGDKLTRDSAATSSWSIRAAISGADEDSSSGVSDDEDDEDEQTTDL
ncbi:hypothetical protein T492DRAFT_885489 [Pavlovales sp. CCMP2436]|nr:hypothetical protein T492DRAFT_885489 [Pavlovales sp. CCMP2436]